MANAETQYQDFEPSTEWIEEEGSRTLIVYLPGFRKEQLKVQVTSTGALKISGERGVAGQKWTRFRHECSIPSDCEINAISAKFQEGMLYVKLPKKLTPQVQQEIEEVKPAATEAPAADDHHQRPEEKAKNGDQQHTEEDKQTNEGVNNNAKADYVSMKMKENGEKKPVRNEKKEERVSQGSEELAEDGKLARFSKVDEGKYKKSATELVKELKKPKKVMNLVVAVLMAVVLGLYVTNAIRSLGKPKNTIQ